MASIFYLHALSKRFRGRKRQMLINDSVIARKTICSKDKKPSRGGLGSVVSGTQHQ